MVRDIPARGDALVALVYHERDPFQNALGRAGIVEIAAALPRIVAPDEADEIHDVAAFDARPVVHVGFGKAQRRIAGDAAGHFAIHQSKAKVGPARLRFAIAAHAA